MKAKQERVNRAYASKIPRKSWEVANREQLEDLAAQRSDTSSRER